MSYKPPKPPLRIKSAPRFGEVYWCDFSISNVLPEFDDVHPVVVVRSGQRLDAPHTVVPLTSVDHEGDFFAYRLPRNPVPKRPDRVSWVLGNHIYTVASERLFPLRDSYDNPAYPRLGDDDMREVGIRVRRALKRIIEASLANQDGSG